MAVFTDTVITEFLTKNTGMAKELAKFSSAGATLAKLKGQGADVDFMLKQLQTDLGKGSTAFKVLEKSMADTYQQGQQMGRLGPMFAFLFGGMALKRLGLSITRFVLPAMDKLQGYVSDGTRQVNAMRASFEFLKFSMFEALTSTEIFKSFVDILITGTNWLSRFVAEHPNVFAFAAAVGGVLTALGTLAIGAGLFNQFAMMASYLGVGKSVSGAPSLLAGVSKLSSLLKTGLGAGLVVKGALEGFEAINVGTLTDADFWSSLAQTVFFTSVGLKLLGAGAFALPITISVAAAIVAFTFTKDVADQAVIDTVKNRYAGVTDEAIASALELKYDDEAINRAFMGGEQGTVVPDFVTKSWDNLSMVADDSTMMAANAIDNNLVNGAFPVLDESIVTVGNTAQTEIIDRWNNWQPITKVLRIKVVKSGDDDGPRFKVGTDISSVTGG